MRPRDLKKGLNLLLDNALASKVYAQEVLKHLYNSFILDAFNTADDEIELYNLLIHIIAYNLRLTVDKFGLDINSIITNDIPKEDNFYEREDS